MTIKLIFLIKLSARKQRMSESVKLFLYVMQLPKEIPSEIQNGLRNDSLTFLRIT